MPESLFDFPAYTAGYGLSNGHFQTVFPHMFRRIKVPFQRTRLELEDGDFLLLDTLAQENKAAPWLVISHGLEGSTDAQYVHGIAKVFYAHGWSIQAWNFRSCGGEMNRLPRFYHSGSYDDLKQVIAHVEKTCGAEKIFLAGFSMGGNQTVLALADQQLPESVIGGAAYSVPLDLTASAHQLRLPAQRIYMSRFLKNLKPKIEYKARQFPRLISATGYDEIKDFHLFDQRYTAPLHGFDSALEYWRHCSSKPVLKKLRKPTLIVNAQNDPFLSHDCKDCRLRDRSKNLHMEVPLSGGHVGFARWRINQPLWTEMRALSFAHNLIAGRI